MMEGIHAITAQLTAKIREFDDRRSFTVIEGRAEQSTHPCQGTPGDSQLHFHKQSIPACSILAA